MTTNRTPAERDAGALLLRLTVGGLMLFHGVDKLMGGIDWLPGALAKNGLPGFLAPGVYVGEVVGPVLLMLGVATRSAAAAIIFTMLVAVYMLHSGDLFSLGSHGEYALELHVFYAAGALASALMGPGRYAVPTKGWLAKL
ncbi:MAG: DoxX family protein [Proteobacteria bacterium]|nr:DoxX family protein [Pseudomonadota bacterium]